MFKIRKEKIDAVKLTFSQYHFKIEDSNNFVFIPFLLHLGVRTGKCVLADRGKAGLKVCQIYSWCPVEIDVVPMPDFNLT